MYSHSLRAEVTRLIVMVILISVALAGGISLITIYHQEDVSVERLMSLICETRVDQMNASLSSVEQSVRTAARHADISLEMEALARGKVIGATGSGISLPGHDFDGERQREFDAYLQRHVDEVESVFYSIAAEHADILDFYYRINPEISHEVQGFLCSKSEGNGFVSIAPTDLTTYPSNDYVHVGWFYFPQETGRPTWVDPYFDQNQAVEMISFVAPVYKADTFIGVIGMDMLYDSLVEKIQGLSVLSSGYAFLTDSHGKIVYHPSLPRQMSIGDINAELKAAEGGTDSSSLITYSFDGVRKKAAWRTLDNGMRLIISAPLSEVNATWYELLAIILVSTGAIIAVFVVMVMSRMRKITEPLEDLTEAAAQLAGGDFDVALTYDQDDEVGVLTRSFRLLVENLKVHIAELNDRAYRDALTQVRNKASYDVHVARLESALRLGECPGFAVVTFDCNELKAVNDGYGHDKGDLYLQLACRTICKVFTHSPVFRVGGDEFTCILTERDYDRRDELLEEFATAVALATRQAEEPWEYVSVAVGMASYDAEIDQGVEDVVRRADERMYANKNAHKEGLGLA